MGKEMQEALIADGQKLKDLTGEDHGPEFFDDCCQCCGGEGVIWNCFDGFCEDAEIGCDDCTQSCPECCAP